MMKRASGRLLISIALAALAACDSGASSADTATVPQAAPPRSQQVMPRTSATPQIAPATIEDAIASSLRLQYAAGYDEVNRCWRTERGEGDEATAYCMRPLPEHVIRDGDATWIYVALASASDIRDHADYLYWQVDAGVMDAFKLRIGADGAPTVVAKGLGLPFGSAGDCGCRDAEFVQVGPRTHGWMFTSGGTWQGETVASYALVAPVGGTFRDIAALPRYVEGDRSVEYRLTIAPATSGDWYPLRYSQWRDGTHVSEAQLRFDPALGRYHAPDAP